MSHRIEPNRHYTAGESIKWTFTVEDDGSAFDISGATLSWYLLDRKGQDFDNAAMSDEDSGVDISFETDGTDGKFSLAISENITDGMEGDFWQVVEVDPSDSSLQRWAGPFPIGSV